MRCTCDWYAYACNTHVQARDYRRNVCTILRAIRHIPGARRIQGGGIQARFDFVVGVTNFRRGSSLHCETYLRVTIIRQRSLLSLLNYANIYRYLSRLIFLILSFTLLFLYTLFEDSFDLKNLISMKFAKSNQFHFYIYFRIILSKSSFKS